MEQKTLRQTEPPWALVARAVGGPRQVAGKLGRLGRTLRLWLDGREIERRLRQLQQAGLVRSRPGRLQLFFGGLDMMRFVVAPAARDYYERRGISFGFHQLLRILDDPTSMIDPTGVLSDRDTIIGHLMQVVHFHPVYDLQLMEMWSDGLDELERQVERMVDGSHPRSGTIGAIVEEAGYHERLLDYVRRYRRDPDTPELVREAPDLRRDPAFAAAERTFATLPGFFAYCEGLPGSAGALLRRLLVLREFPMEQAGEAVRSA
jgi:hypothetical protein